MPLPYHASEEIAAAWAVAEYQPHEVVLSVLAPSVQLRAVWRRRMNPN